jgi:hypothetical protein
MPINSPGIQAVGETRLTCARSGLEPLGPAPRRFPRLIQKPVAVSTCLLLALTISCASFGDCQGKFEIPVG